MPARDIHILLHEGHYAVLVAEDGPPQTAQTDWLHLESVDRLQEALAELESRLPAADTRACLIYDAGMAAPLARLLQTGLALYAEHWCIEDWAQRLGVLGGVFDYPLPPLDAVRAALQQAGATQPDVAPPAGPDRAPGAGTPPEPAPEAARPREADKGDAADEQDDTPRLPLSHGPYIEDERLIELLYALYVSPFTGFSGVDLALLIGRVEPFVIPSPYPEPDPDTLASLQRRFRAMTPDEQDWIIRLAHAASSRLRPRPEMRDLDRLRAWPS